MNLSNLDLVDALAAHFRLPESASAGKHLSLKIPPVLCEGLEKLYSPQDPAGEARFTFTTNEARTLVGSIGEDEFERWCLLDATAFTFVTRALLEAAPCLAKDQGLFRLIVSDLHLEALETLRDEKSELGMPEKQLIDYKDIIGECLAFELITYFIEKEDTEFSRRWAGLLLAELLWDSELNRNRVWKMPDQTFKDLGEMIISGADRMLKIVAGKIIWQMMQEFENDEEIRYRLPAFCKPGDVDTFTKGFPLQNGSQWENGFANFITVMEENRYEFDMGQPTGYNGYQVKLGSNSPLSSELGSISIGIAEIFSIYIPPNRDHSPDWVDFKILNISRIEFTDQDIVGEARKDFIYFKLHLCDYEKDGYLYLLSMRPSSDSDNVMILCHRTDAEDFAEDVERYRDKALRRKSYRLPLSSAPAKDIQANPARILSQKEKLDELERHRDDILKVLISPTKSLVSSTSVTDLSGAGDYLNPLFNEEGTTERYLVAEKGEIDGSNSKDPDQNLKLSSKVSEQRVSPCLPGLAPEETEIPGSSPPVYHTTKELSGDNPEGGLRSSSRYFKPPTRAQQIENNLSDLIRSDSELTEITDVIDEQMELLFRDTSLKGKKAEKPSQLKKRRNGSQSESSRVARRLDFSGKGSGAIGELRDKPKDPILLISTSHAPANVGGEAGKSAWPTIPDGVPLFRDIVLTGNHSKSKSAPGRRAEMVIPDITTPRTREKPIEKGKAVETEMGTKRKPRPVIRNLSGLLDNILVIEEPVGPVTKNPTGSRIFVNPEIHTKEKTVSGDKAGGTPRAPVPGKSITGNTSVNTKHIGLDITKKKFQGADSKVAVDSLDIALQKGSAPKSDQKTRPRAAIRNLTGLLDNVLTPPGSHETKEIIQKKGKLKERLMTKNDWSGTKTDSAQTGRGVRHNAPKHGRTTIKLGNSRLVSPEDTSIWDLPESENSESEERLLLKQGKKKGKVGPQKQTPAAKAPKTKQPEKQKPGVGSRGYEKKQAIMSELKSNEPIVNSGDNKMKLVEGGLSTHASIQQSKSKRKSVIKSKPVPIQAMESKGIASAGGNEFSVGIPKPKTTIQDGNKKTSVEEKSRLTVPQSNNNRGRDPKTKVAPASVKHTAANDSEGEMEEENRKQSARSLKPTLARNIVLQSVPAKRMAPQDSEGNEDCGEDTGPLIKRKRPNQAKPAKAKSSRPAAQKTPMLPQSDIFQNISEVDDDNLSRPRTRLQAKLELARSINLQNKALRAGKKEIKGAAREIKSDNQPSKMVGGISSLATSPRKAEGISKDPRGLSTKLNGREGGRSRSTSPNSKTDVGILMEVITAKKMEMLVEKNHHSPVILLPDRSSPRVNQTSLRRKRRITISSDSSQNDSGSAARSYDDMKAPGGSPRGSNATMNHPGGPDLVISDLKIPDRLIMGRDMENIHVMMEQSKQDVTPNKRGGKSPKNIAPTAPMILELRKLLPGGSSDNKPPSDTSRVPASSEKGGLKLLPVTPKKLAGARKILLDNPDTLIDDRLARKAQIISWDKEGPKNQGRTPVIDKSPLDLRQPEDSANDDLPQKLERSPSFYIMASEDEDRVIRRKKRLLGPFVERPSRRGMETMVNKNGSPLIVPTQLDEIDPVEPIRIDPSSEEDSQDDDIDLPTVDTVDADIVYIDSEYSEDLEQESEPPVAAKKVEGPKPKFYVDIRNTSKEVNRKAGDSSGDDETSSIASSHEEDQVSEKATLLKAPQTSFKSGIKRKISVIEISESELEETKEPEKKEIPQLLAPEHHQEPDISFPHQPMPIERNQHSVRPTTSVSPERSPGLRSAAQNISPTHISREIPTVIFDKALTPSGIGHQHTSFFKWLHEKGLKSNNENHNGHAAPQRPGRGLQSESNDAEMDRGSDAGSEGEPERDQEQKRYFSETNSDDSSDTSMDEESESSEEEGEEETPEEEENPLLAWRRSLPDYHRETLTVLDQISQRLLRYLMSSEELAMEVIKGFEKQANEIIERLGESHKKEYEGFLERVNMGKEKVQKKHAKIAKATEDEIIKLQEEKAALKGLRVKMNEGYSTLEDTMSRMMVRLEEELGHDETMKL